MKNKLVKIMIIGLVALGFGSASHIDAQIRPSRATNRQIQTVLIRIETKTDMFKNEVSRGQGRFNNSNTQDNINSYITEFESALSSYRNQFDSRQNASSEVSEVLNRAASIDQSMSRNRMSSSAQAQWRSLKTDLNTLAGYYSISGNWNQPGTINPPSSGFPAYIATDTQLQNLLTRIETKTDVYKNRMSSALDRSIIDNTIREDAIYNYISEFENATDRLKQKFDARQTVSNDASEVLLRAAYIDQFMTRHNLTRTAESQWLNLKTDLNMLATYYRVSSWNWNQTLPPYQPYQTGGVTTGNAPGRRFDARLTGTYRLNTSLSDNVTTVIDRSLGYYATGERDRVRRNLERRLRSPEMIAIEKSGRTVTMASTNSPQVTFEADGLAKTETNDRGRTITTTATADRQDGFAIKYEGERANDFDVSFLPTRDGQLKVTHSIYLDNRNDRVTVSSVYDKTDNAAQWNSVNIGDSTGGSGGIVENGTFIIPNGTQMTAVLNNAITTRDSQTGDRFSMEVTSPSQYRGGVIEGVISKAESSGRVAGRAQISLNFETIRMPNGQTYRFAGMIDSVTAANGDSVTVNNEGTVRDSNQTTKTATRAGIGALLGAVIGAIAGGGTGAAIGAGVGAGAGAGSVLIQGRDKIELGQGSQFGITASAPGNVGLSR